MPLIKSWNLLTFLLPVFSIIPVYWSLAERLNTFQPITFIIDDVMWYKDSGKEVYSSKQSIEHFIDSFCVEQTPFAVLKRSLFLSRHRHSLFSVDAILRHVKAIPMYRRRCAHYDFPLARRLLSMVNFSRGYSGSYIFRIFLW